MFDLHKNKLRYLNDIKTLNDVDGRIKPSRIFKTINGNDEITIDYYRTCLQKIRYCIEDLNLEIDKINSDNCDRADITYIILCVTWIKDAFWNIKKDLVEVIQDEIDSNVMKKYKDFVEAFRSFSIAHPLNTTKHEDFGLNKDYMNIDINKVSGDLLIALCFESEQVFHLSLEGLEEVKNIKNDDFYFTTYDKKGKYSKFSFCIGCKFSDLYEVAQAYIDKLYEIDLLIRRLAKKHII